MGLMTKLFGRGQENSEATPPAPALCPHTTMTPRWDRAEDIGHEDRATGFRCEGCGRSFSPEEARDLRAHEVERLKATLPSG